MPEPVLKFELFGLAGEVRAEMFLLARLVVRVRQGDAGGKVGRSIRTTVAELFPHVREDDAAAGLA